MKIDITQPKVYIPKYNGNRDFPNDEKIIVHYESLKYLEALRIQKEYGADTESNNAAVEHSVKKIENLVIKDAGGNEKQIETGAQLVSDKNAPFALVNEIVQMLTKDMLLGPELEKN